MSLASMKEHKQFKEKVETLQEKVKTLNEENDELREEIASFENSNEELENETEILKDLLQNRMPVGCIAETTYQPILDENETLKEENVKLTCWLATAHENADANIHNESAGLIIQENDKLKAEIDELKAELNDFVSVSTDKDMACNCNPMTELEKIKISYDVMKNSYKLQVEKLKETIEELEFSLGGMTCDRDKHEEEADKLYEENEELKTSLQTTTSYHTDKYELLKAELNEESQQRLKNKECWMSVQKQYHGLKEENEELKEENASMNVVKWANDFRDLKEENKKLKERVELYAEHNKKLNSDMDESEKHDWKKKYHHLNTRFIALENIEKQLKASQKQKGRIIKKLKDNVDTLKKNLDEMNLDD